MDMNKITRRKLDRNTILPDFPHECEESNRRLGFTLIELSIVLVIIGLIVGGVLVGQDLIKAAQIRATVQQLEKYNSAVNTFQTKFNGMPGDLQSTKATQFGLTNRAGSAGRGDGNGLIDGTITSPSAWTQEAGLFWVDLSAANLVDGQFNWATDAAAPIPVSGVSVALTFPLAKVGGGNYINVGSSAGLNYFMITGILSAVNTGAIVANGTLTPVQAYNMDNKVDDGSPLTGIVQARGAANATSVSSITQFTDGSSAASTATSGDCVYGDTAGTATTDSYNISVTLGGTTPACNLRFRFN